MIDHLNFRKILSTLEKNKKNKKGSIRISISCFNQDAQRDANC